MSRPRTRAASMPWFPLAYHQSLARRKAHAAAGGARAASTPPYLQSSPLPGGDQQHQQQQHYHPLRAIERARRRSTLLLVFVSLSLLGVLGWRWLWAASSSSRGQGGAGLLNGSWRYGRYHDHVAGLAPEDGTYRDLLAAAGAASWAQHPAATAVRCPAFNASRLPADLWGRNLFVAANLKDNAGVMANFVRQLRHLAVLFPSRLFVSVYESNSEDATPRWLEALRMELAALGVPHEVVTGTGGAEGTRRKVEEDRIAFLARMRNRAMAPLYEGRARAGPAEDERFDHVVFVNDVFFCAYEVLRLMLYDADLACGMDLFLEPEPHKYAARGEPEAAAIRRELTFYDLWVARDERGQRFDWAPPFAKAVRGREHAPWRPGANAAPMAMQTVYSKRMERGWETREEAGARAAEAAVATGAGGGGAAAGAGPPVRRGQEISTGPPFPEHTDAFPAFCCWNGLAVLGAEPFYRGLRFRSSRPGRGVVSECTNLCVDLWANGRGKVVVDPQVKLAYDDPTYERIQEALPPRYPDLHAVDRDIAPAAVPPTLSTCYLETGRAKGGAMVRFEECRDDTPTAEALAEAPRFDQLCLGEKEEQQQQQQQEQQQQPNGAPTEIPRVLLQLAPFPLSAEEAAVGAPLPWYRRLGLSKSARRAAEAQLVLQAEAGPREWRALWDDWRRLHVGYEARLVDRAEAEAAVATHFPLAVPVLRRLAGWGEWGLWRTLVSLSLLYHHGGVLVSPGRYRPLRSTACLGPLTATAAGLALDLQARHRGYVERVPMSNSSSTSSDGGGGSGGHGWEPDLGVLAAPRHDPAVRRAVQRLFFSPGALATLGLAREAVAPQSLLRGAGDGGGDGAKEEKVAEGERPRTREEWVLRLLREEAAAAAGKEEEEAEGVE